MKNKIELNIAELKQKGFKDWQIKSLQQLVSKNKNGQLNKLLKYLLTNIWTDEQWTVLYSFIEQGIKTEDFLKIANPSYSVQKMHFIKTLLDNGYNIKDFSFIINNDKLSDEQIEIVEDFLEAGYPPSAAIQLFDPKLPVKELEKKFVNYIEKNESVKPKFKSKIIKEGVNDRKYYIQRAKMVGADPSPLKAPHLKSWQLKMIFDLLWERKSPEAVALLTNPKLDKDQFITIANAIKNGIPYEKLVLFAKPEYSSDQMFHIISAINAGFGDKELNLLLNPKIPAKHMEVIVYALKKGLDTKEIANLMDPRALKSELYNKIDDYLKYKNLL